MRAASDNARIITTMLVWIGAGIAIICALVAVASGLGNRIGAWDYRTALAILRWSVSIGAGAGVVALAGLIFAIVTGAGRRAAVAIVGVAISLSLVLPVWNLQRTARQLPRIHDVTTDTVNPPEFVALLPTRQKAPNGSAYEGAKVAAEQQAGYPDIRPMVIDRPPTQVFDRALAVARSMGWVIAAADRAQGRIEATATTFWFGFKDDVVIRITPALTGSQVDMRSASRVGRSDFGMNARRVREFFAALEAR